MLTALLPIVIIGVTTLLVLSLLAVKYTLIAIHQFYVLVPKTGSNTMKHGVLWTLYFIAMLCVSPYLLVLEFNSHLKDGWVLANIKSINKTFNKGI